MKYSLLNFRESRRRRRETVFIIPASGDPEDCRVLFPRKLERRGIGRLLRTEIAVRSFDECAEAATVQLGERIRRLFRRRLESYGSKLTGMIVGGVVVTLIGIIDFTMADPLPLADELLLIIGGIAAAVMGYWSRKEGLSLFREQVRTREVRVEETVAEPDPILTRLYRGIRLKAAPDVESAGDSVEAETEWFVRHVDARTHLEGGGYDLQDVRPVLSAIRDIASLRRVIRLEQRGSGRRRIRRLRNRVRMKTGLSEDAVTVYSEFVKSLDAYCRERGIRL